MIICEKNAVRVLDDFGIKYIIKKNKYGEAYTCEEVARERNVRLSQVLKCMVGKDIDENVYVMLIPGDKTLKTKKVQKLTGVKKIFLVSREELSYVFKVTVGAITPIQFLGKAYFYLDRTVLGEEFIDISSGCPNFGIELRTSDLIRLIEPVICDIIQTA